MLQAMQEWYAFSLESKRHAFQPEMSAYTKALPGNRFFACFRSCCGIMASPTLRVV